MPANIKPTNPKSVYTDPTSSVLRNAMSANADPTNPDLTNPDSDPANAESTKPELANLDRSDSESVNPDPAALKRTDSEPANADPTKPDPADPDPTNLDRADPTNLKPADANLDPANSDPANSDPADADSANPDSANSDPANPDSADFELTSFDRADPESTNLKPTDAEPTITESAGPEPTESEPAVADPAAAPAEVASAEPDPHPDPTSAEPNATTDPTDRQQPTKPPRATSKRSTTSSKVRLARAYLMRVAEPPATALLAFVDAVGPVEAANAVRAADVSPKVLAETSARRHLELAESDLADAARAGARLVVPEDEEWPAWPLLSLAAACDRGQRWAGSPLGLWARGPAHLADTFERAVSVIGARSATGYGEFVAADIAHGLASAGMTVVSGAAYGIDGCAHRGALAAEGTTVAVLGCGVDIGYPAGHVTLIDRIADSGLVLSEYPPGTSPAKHRFLVRNRLIAALSSGTVVVEAGLRSGARNTATTAAALGKVVLAVPGPITSAASAGCHDLLRTGGAMIAGSIPEILEAVGPVGEHLHEPPTGPTRRTDGLARDALRVHEALRRRVARTPAQVAVESGVPIDRVRALLPELELTGLAERCEEGWRQTPEP